MQMRVSGERGAGEQEEKGRGEEKGGKQESNYMYIVYICTVHGKEGGVCVCVCVTFVRKCDGTY